MRLARTAEPLDTGVAAIAGRTNDAHRKVRLRADIHVKSTMLRAGACGDSRWKDGPCALELDEAVVAARRARSGAARAPTDAAARVWIRELPRDTSRSLDHSQDKRLLQVRLFLAVSSRCERHARIGVSSCPCGSPSRAISGARAMCGGAHSCLLTTAPLSPPPRPHDADL